MTIHTTEKWPAERPRSASLSVPSAGRFVRTGGVVANWSLDAVKGRALDALDLDTRALRRNAAGQLWAAPLQLARHLPLDPSLRAPLRHRSFDGMWRQDNDVVALQPGQTSGQHRWPDGDLTLLGRHNDRYVLYQGASGTPGQRIVGPNGCISLVSLHDDTPVGPGASPRPILFGVAKTFVFADLALGHMPGAQRGQRSVLKAPEWHHVRSEVNAHWRLRAARGGTRSGGARPAWSPRAGLAAASATASNGHAYSVASHRTLEPQAILKQRMEHNGALVDVLHVVYPLGLLDGRSLLHLLGQEERRTLRPLAGARQLLAHLFLAKTVRSLAAFHKGGLFHQDLKPANFLVTLEPPTRARQAGVGTHKVPASLTDMVSANGGKLTLHLADFGNTTANPRGNSLSGTLQMHAPEVFCRMSDPSAQATARAQADYFPAGYPVADQQGVAAAGGLGTFSPRDFSREKDDTWAVGLLLMLLLVPSDDAFDGPALAGPLAELERCPLVPRLVRRPHGQAEGAGRPALAGAEPPSGPHAYYAQNRAIMQQLDDAWRPVHARWRSWHRARGLDARTQAPPPSGHRLPTPNGHKVDAWLSHIAAGPFDFLSFVLDLTEPLGPQERERPPLMELCRRHREASGAFFAQLAAQPAARAAQEDAWQHFAQLLQSVPTGFYALAGKHIRDAEAAALAPYAWAAVDNSGAYKQSLFQAAKDVGSTLAHAPQATWTPDRANHAPASSSLAGGSAGQAGCLPALDVASQPDLSASGSSPPTGLTPPLTPPPTDATFAQDLNKLIALGFTIGKRALRGAGNAGLRSSPSNEHLLLGQDFAP